MFEIFNRAKIFYGGRRRLIKWIDSDFIQPLSTPVAGDSYLLMETNDFLLLEDGHKIILE